MKQLPPWKVKREVLRLGRQIVGAPANIFERFLSTIYHDLFERRHVKRFDGVVPRKDRVAIYLVFPRKGLLASHKMAIEHLRENGYAPLVVSNLPLSDTDCAWLRENTYKFLKRPNRGYDFGGYREGYLTLGADRKHLEFLAFFNDSVWFPTPNSDNWLPQAEALDVQFAAAASSFGIRKVAFDDFRDIKWGVDATLRNFHYCSYAFLVRREMLQSRAYHRFWKRIALRSEKNRVVRVGEIGQSQFAVRRGFTHGATYDLDTLPGLLNSLPDAQINRIAKNLVTLNTLEAVKLIEKVRPTLDAVRSGSEREDLIRLILTATARIGVTYVLPELLLTYHRFAFLKKSPLGLHPEDSAIMLEIGKSLAGPTGRIIQEEMEQIRLSKGFPHEKSETPGDGTPPS